MPVRRLTDLRQAEAACWMERDDPRLWRTIAGLWELSRRLAPQHYPPGVYKHRDVEALAAQTQRWQRSSTKALAPPLP